MTDKPTPKEIDDLVYELRQAGKDDTYSLARAVLAKWGAPAGAGEPFGYFHQLLNHEGKGNGVWLGAAERKVVEQAHTPGETSEEIVALYTTPQPTHAQAVAEPLTDEQIKALMQAHRTAMLMTCKARVPECGEFAAIAQDLDWLCESFGIKGGQHGTE